MNIILKLNISHGLHSDQIWILLSYFGVFWRSEAGNIFLHQHHGMTWPLFWNRNGSNILLATVQAKKWGPAEYIKIYLTTEPHVTADWGQQRQATSIRPDVRVVLTIAYSAPTTNPILHYNYKLYLNECPTPPLNLLLIKLHSDTGLMLLAWDSCPQTAVRYGSGGLQLVIIEYIKCWFNNEKLSIHYTKELVFNII